MRIILLEDDQMLGKAIKNALENEGDVVDWFCDFEECELALKSAEFEILLLDINLPEKSGLEILKNLRRQKNNLPVLILTARDSVAQKIEGLDLGADDYLAKPFDLEELCARIRSLVRRSKGISSTILRHKNIELNPANSTLLVDNIKVDLSPKEFAILKFLLENINKTISKNRLEQLLYSWEDSLESNAVEVHIHNLRKKIGKDMIKNIRGFGYIMNDL
ncbi:MAG: response regulator [Rickettsiales bacterium]|nr:response regulator [Rickettsiales bacterium]